MPGRCLKASETRAALLISGFLPGQGWGWGPRLREQSFPVTDHRGCLPDRRQFPGPVFRRRPSAPGGPCSPPQGQGLSDPSLPAGGPQRQLSGHRRRGRGRRAHTPWQRGSCGPHTWGHPCGGLWQPSTCRQDRVCAEDKGHGKVWGPGKATSPPLPGHRALGCTALWSAECDLAWAASRVGD